VGWVRRPRGSARWPCTARGRSGVGGREGGGGDGGGGEGGGDGGGGEGGGGEGGGEGGCEGGAPGSNSPTSAPEPEPESHKHASPEPEPKSPDPEPDPEPPTGSSSPEPEPESHEHESPEPEARSPEPWLSCRPSRRLVPSSTTPYATRSCSIVLSSNAPYAVLSCSMPPAAMKAATAASSVRLCATVPDGGDVVCSGLAASHSVVIIRAMSTREPRPAPRRASGCLHSTIGPAMRGL